MPDPSQIPYVNQVRELTDIDAIRDVPVIGNLYGAANAVIDFAESDCHPDWNVYLETLFPALGEAVLVLLTFGIDDVLRGYLRPAGGRGFGGLGRASRRTKRLTRAQRARGLLRGGIPEVGELIGRHLPGAQIVRGRRVGSFQQWVFKIDGLAQRGLWYWMVADVTEDFLVNWTTAIMESEECRCGNGSGVERSQSGGLYGGGGIWTAEQFLFIDEEWGSIDSTAIEVAIPEGLSGSVTYELEPGPVISGSSMLAYRMVDVTTGGVVATLPPFEVSPDPEARKRALSFHVTGGHRYQLQYSQTGGTQAKGNRRLYAWASC